MQNTSKQNYPGLVAFYITRQGNKVHASSKDLSLLDNLLHNSSF